MTVSDIQSGMGLGGQLRSNDEGEFNEENGLVGGRPTLINEQRTMYETKSEVRKREMKATAKQPLNSLCNCGSNKKYKNCCIKKNE